VAAGATKLYFEEAVRKVWGCAKRLLPPTAAKEDFSDRHFDQFCEAKLIKMAI
jgi:hypothetical protein